MKKLILLVSCICLLLPRLVLAQDKHAFANDVRTIVEYDKMFQVPPNPIVFVGSSSIRKWVTLQQAFGKHNVINRGIGGAVINDIVYYVNELVVAYKPKQVVIYVGENDLVSKTETTDTILNRTIVLYKAIRAKLPDVPIAYISLKPSPVRDQYQQKCMDANKLIKAFISTQKNAEYIDVFTPMLKDGKSRPELFVGDMLHMNADGYKIWEKIVGKYLVE